MVAASVLAMSAPAQAAKFLITYTGTVLSGFDAFDDFGVGFDLSRASYVAKFTLDTAVNADVTSDSMRRSARGGAGTGFASPFTNVEFTINSRSVLIDVNPIGQVFYANNDNRFRGTLDFIRHQSGGDSIDSQFYTEKGLMFQITDSDLNLIDSTDYTKTFNFNASDPQNANIPPFQRFGTFGYVQRTVGANASTHVVQANLIVSTLTVAPLGGSPVGGVPEPASWALMIAGFGLVGGAMRQRRIALRVTYA